MRVGVLLLADGAGLALPLQAIKKGWDQKNIFF